MRLDRLSDTSARHCAETALRSFKVVQTSVDSLLTDLRRLEDSRYTPIEPIQARVNGVQQKADVLATRIQNELVNVAESRVANGVTNSASSSSSSSVQTSPLRHSISPSSLSPSSEQCDPLLTLQQCLQNVQALQVGFQSIALHSQMHRNKAI